MLMKRCVLGASLSMALLLVSCHDNKAVTHPPMPVAVTKIVTTPIPLRKSYIGITQSIAAVGIRARVEGFLIEKNFIEGEPVKKGQQLFVIDPSSFQAQLSLAEGQLARAVANKNYQQVQYQRLKNLVKKGDVSQSNYDEVCAKFAAAEAEIKTQQAQVDVAKINLGYCSMTSPVDGIIGEKFVDVGNLVGAGEKTLLANVVQLNPIYVLLSPSVEDYGTFLKYRDNMPFKVLVSLPNNSTLKFTGKVDLVNNKADTPTSTILMRAMIDNPQQLLLPGIYVNTTLELTNAAPTILIPTSAVMEAQGQRTVYVVNKKNQVEARIIKTEGIYQQQYIIASGVDDGDLLILSGLQKIRPGEVVTPEIQINQGKK